MSNTKLTTDERMQRVLSELALAKETLKEEEKTKKQLQKALDRQKELTEKLLQKQKNIAAAKVQIKRQERLYEILKKEKDAQLKQLLTAAKNSDKSSEEIIQFLNS